MLKTIQNKQVDIELEDNKILGESFYNFICKGIESGYAGGIYKPCGDRIGKWQLKENKRNYLYYQEMANIKGY